MFSELLCVLLLPILAFICCERELFIFMEASSQGVYCSVLIFAQGQSLAYKRYLKIEIWNMNKAITINLINKIVLLLGISVIALCRKQRKMRFKLKRIKNIFCT